MITDSQNNSMHKEDNRVGRRRFVEYKATVNFHLSSVSSQLGDSSPITGVSKLKDFTVASGYESVVSVERHPRAALATKTGTQ